MSETMKWLLALVLVGGLVKFIDDYCVTSRSGEIANKLQTELSLYKGKAAQLEAELASARLRCSPERR